MRSSLIYGADNVVSNWVSEQLFGVLDQFTNANAIGVSLNGKIIAGVVYNNFFLKPDGSPLSMELSIASVDKRWATRHNLRAFFSYPFIQLGLERIWTQCSVSEGEIMNFNKRLGFKQEGVHRKAWPMGGDAMSFGMLKEDCKWL